jgi:hypothetical protein
VELGKRLIVGHVGSAPVNGCFRHCKAEAGWGKEVGRGKRIRHTPYAVERRAAGAGYALSAWVSSGLGALSNFGGFFDGSTVEH